MLVVNRLILRFIYLLDMFYFRVEVLFDAENTDQVSTTLLLWSMILTSGDTNLLAAQATLCKKSKICCTIFTQKSGWFRKITQSRNIWFSTLGCGCLSRHLLGRRSQFLDVFRFLSIKTWPRITLNSISGQLLFNLITRTDCRNLNSFTLLDIKRSWL